MTRYHQLTSGERYALSALRRQGCTQAEIARAMCRHPSTISREVRRNRSRDGRYRPPVADDFARRRRSRSRRNQHFTIDDWAVRSPVDSGRRASSGSVTRPSTAASGTTSAGAACFTFTYGVRTSSAASATAATTPAAGSRAKGPSPSDLRVPRTGPVLAISRATRCSEAPTSTAS